MVVDIFVRQSGHDVSLVAKIWSFFFFVSGIRLI
jgi:hypothetical protein